MKNRIALLPVDGRPVTRNLPMELAHLAGWQVVAPEVNDLGFLKQPACVKEIRAWLMEIASYVDGLVLSIDMLLYGGLVPSRIHVYQVDELIQRMGLLKELKETYPDITLMAFSSTMRISNNNINEEEKSYWEDYGMKLWALSYHSHRYEKLGEEQDGLLVEKLKKEIPEDILRDYRNTRQINFTVNKSLLDLVQEGVLDHLVFPQDDTSEFGWNVKEQEELQYIIRNRSLDRFVYLYPGADEVASTLLTRMVFQLEQEPLPSFYPVYSGEKGALVPAMYEDRPIAESVKGQLVAIGSRTEDDFQAADIIIGVNVPGQKQGDLALGLNLHQVDTNDRNVKEWIGRLHAYRKRKPVAVVDVAYANGADPAMVPLLLDQLEWKELFGFAAWNTAGNAIGTTVSQAALIWLADKKGKSSDEDRIKQLVLRMLDDYVYQSITRQKVRAELYKENAVQLNQVATPLYQKEVSRFLTKYASEWMVESIYYPWERTFEVGVNIRKEGLNEG
ncbi:Protein of unknown function [Thalassobacillus cyri]|uniref:DUF4127 family protein n=1 Tax=Thalassobacillus cyri TaxID=571932 RepID=A0A1H3VTL1_9BACI|nr:DUF4127 family protein [Thalassobacillus cyri]SDZ77452.1 Protein of unknown function [Thalassobacillus cyri]